MRLSTESPFSDSLLSYGGLRLDGGLYDVGGVYE